MLGDLAVLDAAKKGCLSRMMKLVTQENVNCRDTQGRNSTPLHLAAGYNNIGTEKAYERLEFNYNCRSGRIASRKGGRRERCRPRGSHSVAQRGQLRSRRDSSSPPQQW